MFRIHQPDNETSTSPPETTDQSSQAMMPTSDPSRSLGTSPSAIALMAHETGHNRSLPHRRTTVRELLAEQQTEIENLIGLGYFPSSVESADTTPTPPSTTEAASPVTSPATDAQPSSLTQGHTRLSLVYLNQLGANPRSKQMDLLAIKAIGPGTVPTITDATIYSLTQAGHGCTDCGTCLESWTGRTSAFGHGC